MKEKKKNKGGWEKVMTPFGPAKRKKITEPMFTCPACGNTKNFKIYSSGTIEQLCDCRGNSIMVISEDYKDDGSIDRVVCAGCGEEVK